MRFAYYCIGLLFLFMSSFCFAETIVIAPNTIISHSKTYNDVVLDLTHGSFIITSNATLTINNSIINGNLGKSNPNLITVESGNLQLNNSQFNIQTINIDPHPLTQSLYHVIQVAAGGLTMIGNSFTIDHPFAAGLLVTTASIPTTNFIIQNNKFNGFHGVLYLIASDNALVANNTFTKNTYGNLVLIGNNGKIIQNTIYFSGNNRLGNSIDVIDSSNVVISQNLLFTPTCHGIYIMNSNGVVIDRNRISGGITYAMNVLTYPEVAAHESYLKDIVKNHKIKNTMSNNITITNNYMSQNRYGIAVSDTSGITVQNNIFIQRFEDNAARKFWTDNSILFQNVSNVTWTNNLYKEAFTQENGGDNSNSMAFLPFPQTGGVSFTR